MRTNRYERGTQIPALAHRVYLSKGPLAEGKLNQRGFILDTDTLKEEMIWGKGHLQDFHFPVLMDTWSLQ